MRKLTAVVLSMLVLPALPGITLAANDDPLAKYNNMIKQSLEQPVTSELQKPDTAANRAISSGQAALRPAPPVTAQPAIPNRVMPAQNNTPAQQYSNYSTSNTPANSTDTQPSAPAGPPNIFITPGGNSTNTSKDSVIHY